MAAIADALGAFSATSSAASDTNLWPNEIANKERQEDGQEVENESGMPKNICRSLVEMVCWICLYLAMS